MLNNYIPKINIKMILQSKQTTFQKSTFYSRRKWPCFYSNVILTKRYVLSQPIIGPLRHSQRDPGGITGGIGSGRTKIPRRYLQSIPEVDVVR